MVVVIISGRPGSGKSTIASAIAKKFKLNHFSAGDAMREIAVKMGFEGKGIGFMKFHEYVKNNPSIDKRVDDLVRKEARKGNVVIDSWLAGHLIKLSKEGIKIFIKSSINEAAKRIALREKISFNKSFQLCIEREEYNIRRWKELYGIDINDLNPYDVVFDTSKWGIKDMNDIMCYVINKLIKSAKEVTK